MKKLFFLLLLSPVICYAQVANFTPVFAPGVTAPQLSASPLSETGMTAYYGSSGTSVTNLVTFAFITSNVIETISGPFEASVDGGSTWGSGKGFSTGSPYSVLVRIVSGTAIGSVSGSITYTTSGASPVVVTLSGSVVGVPTLSVSPTSLTISTTTGTQSVIDSVVITGTYLSTNVVSVPIPTGYVAGFTTGSLGTTTPLTITPSAGNVSQKVYWAIPSTTTPGTYNLTSSISCTGSGVSPAILTLNGTVSSIPTAQFNFSSSANAVAGWTNVYGNPISGGTFTDGSGGGNTGWVLTINGAAWANYSGFYGGVGNGATQASSGGVFPHAAINSNLYTTTQVGYDSSGGYSMKLGPLPAGTYTVELIGSIPDSIFANNGPSNFWVLFGTTASIKNIGTSFNPNGSGNIGNLVPQGPGTTQVTTGSYTGTLTASQYIYISLGYTTGTGGTGQLGYINGLQVKKTF